MLRKRKKKELQLSKKKEEEGIAMSREGVKENLSKKNC